MAGHLGILISFTLGAYLDWRQLAMLVAVAPIMLFVTVIYVPETPSFLLLKGRDDEAYRYDNFCCYIFKYKKLFFSTDRYSGLEAQIKMLNLS